MGHELSTLTRQVGTKNDASMGDVGFSPRGRFTNTKPSVPAGQGSPRLDSS